MTDMKVALEEFHEWGDEKDPNSNWSLFNEHATFSHAEACEFILYIGSIGSDEVDMAEVYEEIGFNSAVIEVVCKARLEGYKYVCFYC